MNRLLPAFTLAIWLAPVFAQQQKPSFNESCRAVIGADKAQSFLAFDSELRAALAKSDAVAMTMLVEYPMGVSEPDGGFYSMENPEYLHLHFEKIFTAATRKAVLSTPLSELYCRGDEGAMYGNGEIWVEPTGNRGWAIKTVNVDATGGTHILNPSQVEFVCRTEKHQILIESDAKGVWHYRSWNAGHSILGKPDLELSGGKDSHDGSGVCAAWDWTFTSGKATYVVGENSACGGDSGDPPKDSRGQLTVSVEGKPDYQAWCY